MLETFVGNVNRLVSGIRTLAIPRIEDLPYWTSPPIQFVYESTAALAAGVYTWNDAPLPLTPLRPIRENILYYFRTISLAADISEEDFTGAIVVNPQFLTFLQSTAQAPLFREPVQMNKFYVNFDYRLVWMTQSGQDQLFAAFRGTLLQTPALIGKNAITLKAIISAQEIADEQYIKAFKIAYPKVVA